MDFEKGQGEMKLKGNLREIRSRKKIKMGRVWQSEEGGGGRRGCATPVGL